MRSAWSLFGLGALLPTLVFGQAPNNIQYSAPAGDRTASVNSTYTIIPINATVVQAVLPSNYTLLDNFRTDKTLFPQGFPIGMHPVVVTQGYMNEIKVVAAGVPLSIPFLLTMEIDIPFIDVLGDKKTPFAFPIFTLTGGDNGQLASGLIPALVGSLAGTPITPGDFFPDKAAYVQNDPINNPGEFTASGEQAVLDNPASGPGVTNPTFSITFSPTASSPYTPHTFHSMLSQPLILTSPPGMCIRDARYFSPKLFGNTFADPWMTKASVTLYSGTLVSDLVGIPKGFEGLYGDVYGYAATCQELGSANEDCKVSPSRVDPRASA